MEIKVGKQGNEEAPLIEFVRFVGNIKAIIVVMTSHRHNTAFLRSTLAVIGCVCVCVYVCVRHSSSLVPVRDEIHPS